MRYAHLSLLALLLLTMAKVTYASTSSVTINSNTSSNGESSTTSESHVRIETDGVIKEFNTSGNESVDWRSEDGKSSVKIDGSGTSVQSGSESHSAGASGTVTPSPTGSPSSKTSPTPEDHNVSKPQATKIPLTPISMIVTLVESILKLF